MFSRDFQRFERFGVSMRDSSIFMRQIHTIMFLGMDVTSKKQELWLLQDFQDCEETKQEEKNKRC
jgi:hypothetical protein